MTVYKKRYGPIAGDYKITKHFALFPKRIGDYVVWMNTYKKMYEWKVKGNTGRWEFMAEFIPEKRLKKITKSNTKHNDTNKIS